MTIFNGVGEFLPVGQRAFPTTGVQTICVRVVSWLHNEFNPDRTGTALLP